MKKIILALLLIVLNASVIAKDIYGRRQYHIALRACSPLGLMSKYGGGVEFRVRGVSFMPTYIKYTGVYPGTQIGIEYDFFLRSKKQSEFYIYAKGMGGSSAYDRSKLAFFGYGDNDIQLKYNSYYGGGAGFGKRFNFNVFFFTVSGGLKYCVIPDLTTDERHLYNLFFLTGPGSIVDVHVTFGLQL